MPPFNYVGHVLPGQDLLLVAALIIGAAAVVFVGWRLRPRTCFPRGGLHGMGRDDSIGYFRDFGERSAGVREEDRSGRWGDD